jgi:very-short-patch-repair endonuclease
MKCFCDQILTAPPGRHGRFCGAYQQTTEEQRLIFFAAQELCLTGAQIKDLLQQKYILQEASISDLLKHGLKRDQWIKLIEHFGFTYRGSKQATTKSRLQKTEETCLKKFGVKNASQHDDIKRKKAATFVKNYGVDNIWKSDEFKDQYRQTMQERYGKGSLPNRFGRKNEWWATISKENRSKMLAPWREASSAHWSSLSEEQKIAIVQQRLATLEANAHLRPEPRWTSKLEDQISADLDQLGVEYKRQRFIGRNSFDFAFKNRILLEVQGDYWHANPNVYSPDDWFPKQKMTAAQIWEKDAMKKKYAEERGFTVIYLWESDVPK